MTSLLDCGNTLPLSLTRHVASDQSADVSAHSKAAFRIPQGQLVAPKSDEGGRELFSCIHFGMDERGNWRLNLWRKKP
jgi:hypothetical protein